MTMTETPRQTPDPKLESTEPRPLYATLVGNWREALLLPLLAVVTAMAVSALIVVLSDLDNLERLGSAPGSALWSMLTSTGTAYQSLFMGAFGSFRALSETFTNATPYIIAGLAIGLSFRAGLLNIGGLGQMIVGGLCAVWVGFAISAPTIIHLPLAILAGFVGGALYGAIAGVLKARTGAHEVITTIMLNNIALLLLTWVLKTSVFQAEGRVDPISESVESTARLTRLFGFLNRSDLRVHIGLFLALALAVFVGWLLFRTSIGFEFRAVGANPDAAHYAGMRVATLTGAVMALSGGLAGIAGANEVLGVQGRAAPGFAGTIGFDGISVALLGRSHPVGIVASGLLFGALRAGAQEMQAATDVPIDMIQIVQSLIIVFIAAPALIRAIWRVRTATVEGAPA